MRRLFRAIEDLEPGEKWRRIFEEAWPGYHRWFLTEGDAARPSYFESRKALRRHMPELVSNYEQVVDLAGGGDQAARLLSLYRPTPYLTGCSQAVWTRGESRLIRNYDYTPALWDAVLMLTAWNGRRVLAMSDCLWGVLDGINDAGLAVSLAFGGRRVVGEGFGIPLVLRYVLEFCDTTTQAVAALRRIPSHMAYNVTVIDGTGAHATVFVAPDRPALVTTRPIATNHQRIVEWKQHAHATATLERDHFLSVHLGSREETLNRFVQRFLEPPLFSTQYAAGWGTLYTAEYQPGEAGAVFHWPGEAQRQSCAAFSEVTMTIEYRTVT